MTKEELKSLRIGDKVVYIGGYAHDYIPFTYGRTYIVGGAYWNNPACKGALGILSNDHGAEYGTHLYDGFVTFKQYQAMQSKQLPKVEMEFYDEPAIPQAPVSTTAPECHCNRADFTHTADCAYVKWNQNRFGGWR